MNYDADFILQTCNQSGTERYINPDDINLMPGYKIEVFAQGLNTPNCLIFTKDGEMLVAESGYITNNPRVLRQVDNTFEILADNFKEPITGISYLNGNLFVSHKGELTLIKSDGTRSNLISGLPSGGDYGNTGLIIGQDGKLYFGLGTATNSGVVGNDNEWVKESPYTCDYPGEYIMLKGQNFETKNMLTSSNENIFTGAYSPYGVPNMPFEVRKSVLKASGSILRCNPDGSDLELVAWGFRNPARLGLDENLRLFAANHSYENRGSRPVANASDSLYMVEQGLWYGFPDYSAGEPLTSTRFRPEGGKQLEFLLVSHPNIPPRPFVTFPPESTIMGFDFDYGDFGPYGDAYIAEFGITRTIHTGAATPYTGIGHRVTRIDMSTGGVFTFAINKSGFPAFITGEGGFGRPVDVKFGPDKAMYILDFGISRRNMPDEYLAGTGVIWRVTKTS